ncbi:MAG: hypothetical protein ABFD91_00590 [Anaerohalosphaeraceae bacterium]
MMDIFEVLNSRPKTGVEDLHGAQTPRPQEPVSEKMEEIARQFEGVLLHQMFKQAQQTIDQMDTEDDEESEDAGNEQIQSLYWSQMADVVSEQGGMGLWKPLYQQIMQQVNPGSKPDDTFNEGA